MITILKEPAEYWSKELSNKWVSLEWKTEGGEGSWEWRGDEVNQQESEQDEVDLT